MTAAPLKFTGPPAGPLPSVLTAEKRWAPWAAAWNVGRGKWDKIPRRADRPSVGLSTANPARWFTFAEALAAVKAAPNVVAGVGYLMTGQHGIVGVDLDGCVTEGVVADWAAEVLARMGSYSEFSPSGNGLRIFVRGQIADDWTNHDAGVECYAGHAPRFLTLTGAQVKGTPTDVFDAPPGALEWLADAYRKAATKPAGKAGPMPDLLPGDELPNLSDLADKGLARHALAYLAEGELGSHGDRSRTLQATAVALCKVADAQTVLSVLAANDYAVEVALDHRRQDNDRAAEYLWQQVADATPKAAEAIASAEDFESLDVSDLEAPAPTATTPPASAITDRPAKRKLTIQTAEAFAASGAPLRYFVPGVLPEAELISIFGPSGSGKSFIAFHALACVALGRPFFEVEVKQAPVVYGCLEGERGAKLRVMAYRSHYGVTFGDHLAVLTGPVNLHKPGGEAELIEHLTERGSRGIMVLDTLARATPGADEVGSRDMGPVLERCRKIHRATGWTLLLIAHTGKDESRGIRGWSGIKGALDAEIEVTQTATFRAATITKMKDGRGEGKTYTFDIRDVVVDFDADDGDVVAGVAVETFGVAVAGAQKGKPTGLGINQRLVMQALRDLVALGERHPTHSRLIDYAADMKAPPGRGRDTRRQHVGKAFESLVADGHLRFDQNDRIDTTGITVDSLAFD